MTKKPCPISWDMASLFLIAIHDNNEALYLFLDAYCQGRLRAAPWRANRLNKEVHMSLARGSQNAGHYYSNIVMPQEIAVSFVVNPADSGGVGITSLKSNGWAERVFMHTSATPGVVGGVTNPNPASGYAFIQLKQNFNVFLGMDYVILSPTTGAALTSVVTNTTYVINALGTTTTAQWNAVGLPKGFTPAVGQSFVATATQAIGGTGSVKVQTVSGIMSIELIGDPNASISNTNIATFQGAYLMAQFLNTSGVATAPTASTVIDLRLYFDRSSVTIDGL